MKAFPFSHVIIKLILLLVALACILPLLLIVIVSFTAEGEIVRNGYAFFPAELSLDAYRVLLKNGGTVAKSYGLSIFVTVAGTAAATIITLAVAFTLAMLFFITMVFSGGMVPWYIICKKIGLTENILALIIPSLIFNPFNMFLARNFMRDIPISLMESAKLDGANDITIAFRIYLPLCLPIVATIALFYSIGYWNDWWNSIMLVSDTTLYPIQYFLMKLRSDLNTMRSLQSIGISSGGFKPTESLQMATAALTIGPIVLFYPFLQKYIVKGLTIGSVKG